MKKEFVKITFEDLQIAESFFENEKHFSEFLFAVVSYYRGKNFKIKTKIVAKYFETYKKTMNHIMQSKKSGLKGYEQKIEKQEVIKDTLKGVVEASVEPSLSSNYKLVNSNNKLEIINNKIENINDSENKFSGSVYNDFKKIFLDFYFKKIGQEYYFQAKDGAKIKSLIKKIEFKIKEKGKIPQKEKEITDAFSYFLNLIKDQWIINNLSLSTIDSKFNEIISNRNGKKQSNYESKQQQLADFDKALDNFLSRNSENQ